MNENEWLKEVLEEASADVKKWPDWLKDSRDDSRQESKASAEANGPGKTQERYSRAQSA